MIRITVYASTGDGTRPATIEDWSEHGPEEALRRIGLEYKQADYFPTRQVVIVLEPVKDESLIDVQTAIREAVASLEGTGLL